MVIIGLANSNTSNYFQTITLVSIKVTVRFSQGQFLPTRGVKFMPKFRNSKKYWNSNSDLACSIFVFEVYVILPLYISALKYLNISKRISNSEKSNLTSLLLTESHNNDPINQLLLLTKITLETQCASARRQCNTDRNVFLDICHRH